MSVHLVTGYAGEAHVSSADVGAFNAGVVGTGKYALYTGNAFSYSIVSNNLIKIYDGDAIDQGRHIRIPTGTYEEVTIENGTAGKYRIDLIYFEYSKDTATGIEKVELKVRKGTAGSSYTYPSYTTGDLSAGDTMDEMPLYWVRISGLSIISLSAVFTKRRSMYSIDSSVTNVESRTTTLETISSVSLTANSTNAGIGQSFAVKVGNVCIVSICIVLNKDYNNMTAYHVLTVGTKASSKVSGTYQCAASSQKEGVAQQFSITSGSNRINLYTGVKTLTSGDYVRGLLVFPVD